MVDHSSSNYNTKYEMLNNDLKKMMTNMNMGDFADKNTGGRGA